MPYIYGSDISFDAAVFIQLNVISYGRRMPFMLLNPFGSLNNHLHIYDRGTFFKVFCKTMKDLGHISVSHRYTDCETEDGCCCVLWQI
jgi:hypothetical protein